MISNPVSEFVTGSGTREFTYEGGSRLFHFSAKDNGLSKYRDCEVIFFANDEAHALEILGKMFRFIMDRNLEFCQHHAGVDEGSATNIGASVRRARRRMARFMELEKALRAGAVKVGLAPTNQFYQVGWARNDTI